ncbi:MAG: glycoside hydrolase family 15 protein [Acidimicrobiia bacterium]
MSHPIEDYGLIGDTETAALVCRDGSIDWLCLPRFDSGAGFAALLGGPEQGRWKIAPSDPEPTVSRRYRGDTLILETEFRTDTGVVRLTDLMPPRPDPDDGHIDLVRIVEGVSGSVDMEMHLTLRFDYGSVVPWVTRRGHRLHAIAGPDAVVLDTPVAVRGQNQSTVAEFSLTEGERVPFVLTWYPSHRAAPDPMPADEALATTESWWSDWVSQCQFHGEHRDAVVRSLITLKALTFGPTGGIVAAPTTSLPEELGGTRNWDYRYVWLRDATFTLYALIMGGYRSEAAAWRDWLLRAVAGNPENLRIMYGLAGERRIPEMELPWLPGYEGSSPVRIGNAASDQNQLDVYGEVIDALWLARGHGLEQEEGVWAVQLALLEFLEGNWQQEDHGLWEIRGERRHFTHSRVMSWVAFDRAVKTVERTNLEGPVEQWRATRREIRREILTEGYDQQRNTFVQSYGSSAVDAALLLIPQVGLLPPRDRRVLGTIDAVMEDLQVDDVLIRRYRTDQVEDGLSGSEGAFLICSFWLVDALALAGRLDEARRRFTALLELRNDLGLLAEEYDAVDRRMLGNFPQAFSHVGLIDSAHTLADVTRSAAESRGEMGRT